MRPGGIILCGGQSSRMGRPKALLPWGGRPLVAHVAGVLREALPAGADIVLVSAEGLALPPIEGTRVALDRELGLGPLAGLREGLEAIRADLAFATSTDAPFLTPAFVRAMLVRAEGGAAAAESEGFVHPLAAVYPKGLAAVAAELLAAGERRPLRLLERAGFRRVPAAELPDARALRNVNRPPDYLAALREAGLAEAPVVVELFGLARARAGRAEIEVPAGTLEEVLAAAEAQAPALRDLGGHLVAAIDGRRFARDGGAPVGPGERVVVMDAAAGG